MDEQSKTIIALILVLLILGGVAVGMKMGLLGSDDGELLPVNGNIVVTDTNVTTINSMETMNTVITSDSYITTNDSSESFSWEEISERAQSGQNLIEQDELKSSIVVLVIGLVTMYIEYKLYIKVGIDRNTAMWTVIGPLAVIVSIAFKSIVITLAAVLVALIAGLNVYVKFLRIIGINPNLLFLILVPIANYIVILYINVMTAIKLGDKFNKDVLFKLGLFFLAPIFKAILVFDNNNQATNFGRNID